MTPILSFETILKCLLPIYQEPTAKSSLSLLEMPNCVANLSAKARVVELAPGKEPPRTLVDLFAPGKVVVMALMGKCKLVDHQLAHGVTRRREKVEKEPSLQSINTNEALLDQCRWFLATTGY